jgi:pyridoxine kinase
MNILSIQSAVSFGHVGNSAAVFALQRLGHEAWPIATVQLAHHPAHGRWAGRVTPADDIAMLADALGTRGLLAQVDAVLTGYLADAAQGPVVAGIAARVKRDNPAALWALDPVIGDDGRIYVKPGIPEFLRDTAVAAADILTPNAFELGVLTGCTIATEADAVAAARTLQHRGAGGRAVVVTGLRLPDALGHIAALLIADHEAWRIDTPIVNHPAHGAGDLLSALFLGHYLMARDPRAALQLAVASVYGVVARSAAAPPRPGFNLDLRLIEVQNELVESGDWFAARQIA